MVINQDLKFNEERHEYTYNGVIVPSVNRILQDVGLVPPFRGSSKATYGSALHLATHFYDEGRLDWDSLDDIRDGDAIKLGTEQWIQYTESEIKRHILIEKPLAHPFMSYAGTPDRVSVMKDGSVWLIDIKTGQFYKYYLLAMGGYVEMLRRLGIEVAGVKIVSIPKNGKLSAMEVKYNDSGFIACATVYHLKRSVK